MAETPIQGSKLGITLAAMIATLMAVLDISIVNVALTDIRAAFGTPLDRIGWVSVGYMMANIVVIPLTGFLQRRFGYRRYFAGSIALFTLASALCGLAWNLPSLVVFRMLQGLGGGAIIPTAQSLLFARYPREEHSMAGALFGLGAVTGPLLGPTIGGYLIDIASWHWIFLINVPFGIAAIALTLRCLEEPGFRPSEERIDVPGIALLAVGMASLQYVLEEGNREGWFEDRTIVVLAAIATTCLVTFVVHELETEAPVVDLRVFANRPYLAGTLINFLVGVALFSGAYLFSLFCGTVLRYTALDIGLVFLSAGIAQILVMPLLGKLGDRIDGRLLIGGGIVLTTVSMLANARLTQLSGHSDLVHTQLFRAVGIALVIVPLSVMALSSLPESQRGNATGLFNLTRELGGSIGTAWMGTMLDRGARIETGHLAANVTAFSQPTNEQLAMLSRGALSGTVDPFRAALSILERRVELAALIRAFGHAFSTVGLVIGAAVVLVLFLERPKPGVVIEGAH